MAKLLADHQAELGDEGRRGMRLSEDERGMARRAAGAAIAAGIAIVMVLGIGKALEHGCGVVTVEVISEAPSR
jgi:hypothetical protein